MKPVATMRSSKQRQKATGLALRDMRETLYGLMDELDEKDPIAESLRRVIAAISREISILSGDAAGQARLDYMRNYMRRRRAKKNGEEA